MSIDFSTDIGRVRLRVADIGDLPYLPDSVYSQTLADNNGNLVLAAKDIACTILGILSFKSHKKLAQLEVWGGESFSQYKEFLILTVKDPAFMKVSPVPYVGTGDRASEHPLIKFQREWNLDYSGITFDQQLDMDAVGFTINSL